MKTSFLGFGKKIVRAALAVAACALLMFGAVSPAVAFGSSPSSPSKGTAEMNDLQATSKQAVRGESRSLEEVQSKAENGLNGVQGSAGANKMNTPGDSQEATSLREKAENMLDSSAPDR
ncbi:MAG: hypothetical protein ACFBSF_02520 [Leptolyngbyaceae cyanobacterium]